MSLPHFLTGQPFEEPAETNGLLPLEERILKHMAAVRLAVGEHFSLSDGNGTGREYELLSPLHKGDGKAEVQFVRSLARGPRAHLTLVQGISVGERMDQAVRMAAELGVARIIPFLCERSTVHIDTHDRPRKRDRWQRVALAAAEQAGLLDLPVVEEPQGLDATLSQLCGYDAVICAWEEPGGVSLHEALAPVRTGPLPLTAALFIGPEGGLTLGEVDTLRGAGATVVTLGDTILRTETAAAVASALVLYELGGLGNVDA
ncbi:MAG: 16S rRNA (uracil(1498)-N(3))-methyltransferase [Coriobacteriales bacterium]|jgi:16S rRNA (uracil1498-N3)-methyltransferase|nr:16S rRNA (uracil(1498)-N(3))-methyltransferase [Coriobacteriales bacterium]